MSVAGEVEVTSAPSSSGDITLTVNSTDYVIALDGTETVDQTARAIVDYLKENSDFTDSNAYDEFAYIWSGVDVDSLSFTDTDSTGVNCNTSTFNLFHWRGDREYNEEYSPKTLVTQFENGPEQRRNKQKERRIFRLNFTKFANIADDILAFHRARNGQLESFYWNNPDTGEMVTVRFARDTLSRLRIYDRGHEFQIILREVFGE